MSEGIKNQVSLQTHQVARRRPPLAIYTDRLVRQYVEHESAAYELISLCKPDALHSEGKRAEAYVHHHVIDYRPPNPGAPLRTMVLVVTSRRVVFGSVNPPRVKFEARARPAAARRPRPAAPSTFSATRQRHRPSAHPTRLFARRRAGAQGSDGARRA